MNTLTDAWDSDCIVRLDHPDDRPGDARFGFVVRIANYDYELWRIIEATRPVAMAFLDELVLRHGRAVDMIPVGLLLQWIKDGRPEAERWRPGWLTENFRAAMLRWARGGCDA